jgi:hypothetical protein
VTAGLATGVTQHTVISGPSIFSNSLGGGGGRTENERKLKVRISLCVE